MSENYKFLIFNETTNKYACPKCKRACSTQYNTGRHMRTCPMNQPSHSENGSRQQTKPNRPKQAVKGSRQPNAEQGPAAILGTPQAAQILMALSANNAQIQADDRDQNAQQFQSQQNRPPVTLHNGEQQQNQQQALSSKANELYAAYKYEESLQLYKRALESNPVSIDAGTIHLNMAAPLLHMENFDEAYRHAQTALLSANVGREKTLARLTRASIGLRDKTKALHWLNQFQSEFPHPETAEGKELLEDMRIGAAAASENVEPTTGEHDEQQQMEPTGAAAAGDEQLTIQQTPPLPSTPHNEPGPQPKAVDDPSAQGEAERTGVVEANAPADIPDDGCTKRRLNRDMQQQASEREQQQAKRTRFTNAQFQGQLDYMVGFFNKAKEKVERKNQKIAQLRATIADLQQNDRIGELTIRKQAEQIAKLKDELLQQQIFRARLEANKKDAHTQTEEPDQPGVGMSPAVGAVAAAQQIALVHGPAPEDLAQAAAALPAAPVQVKMSSFSFEKNSLGSDSVKKMNPQQRRKYYERLHQQQQGGAQQHQQGDQN